MLTLKNLPENKYNFLRFYTETNPSVDTSQYVEGLHNGYLYRWRTHADILPVLTEDELVFYTNFATDLIGTNDVKVLEGDTIINNVALYDITVTPFGDTNSKIELTIPVTNTKNNQVFSIGIVDDDNILYRSNCFILKSRTEKNINNTHLLQFYNNSNIYGYEWSEFDTDVDLPYTVRIASSIKDLSYEKDQTIYRSATSGVSRVTRATTSKTYQFETYYNNEDFHDAFSIVSSFKNFVINNKQYICEEYKTEYQSNLNIFKGVASLKDVEYGRRINVCSNLT